MAINLSTFLKLNGNTNHLRFNLEMQAFHCCPHFDLESWIIYYDVFWITISDLHFLFKMRMTSPHVFFRTYIISLDPHFYLKTSKKFPSLFSFFSFHHLQNFIFFLVRTTRWTPPLRSTPLDILGNQKGSSFFNLEDNS